MVRQRMLFAGLLLASSGAFAAGPYTEPYALIEAGDPSQVRQEFIPAITQIDGDSTMRVARGTAIPPGPHKVKIRFSTGRVVQSPADEEREIAIDAKACVRYRVVAARTKGTDWEPKVYEEKIGECVRKFQKKPGS